MCVLLQQPHMPDHAIYRELFFFFFKQKTAYEMQRGLVGSEMCIRDRYMGIALGEIMWKKRDWETAKKCNESAIESNPKSKEAYQNLSIVIKKLGDEKEKARNVEESIRLAHKAIEIDMEDGYSWFLLGNSYLANFFANMQSHEELDRSLKAYHQSESKQKFKNPDLYFNRAEVHGYLENYKEAVADYLTAHGIDPTLLSLIHI
eukprot:TRINITY_DN53333_c0_g1_i1.p2 TRINITY_DN53333_c0_g1~~TRINITY_DN53333_c0_g1_i1.p2  ORF type:complete len:204 (+),score=49.66 TRINITY_DN53333_c0_g1_i1:15-626(+)